MSSPPRTRSLKRPGTTAEALFERLVQAILDGQFTAGEPLREARLARAWHVSRTPLREAVRRAAEAGFVTLRPNQAPVVRQLTGADIAAIYDLRALLEMRAFDLAWPHFQKADIATLDRRLIAARPGQSRGWQRRCLAFDRALHESWMDRCGNPWLAADLQRHYRLLLIFQGWMGRDDRALERAYREHLTILRELRGGNRSAARRALDRHIANSARAVQAAVGAGGNDK